MSAPLPRICLVYFDFEGKAQAIRLALFIAGIPFTDQRIDREEWRQLKSLMPYGQLPVLEVTDEDGSVTRIPQSLAILTYVGRLAGLFGWSKRNPAGLGDGNAPTHA